MDAARRTADVLGMTTYEDLVDATLRHGLMPLVVPELKTITLGGAVTGLGIESTSFRNGCPHESVLDFDVLTGDGRVLTVTPDGPHADLFTGFPNSYGTLGLRAAAAHRAASRSSRSSRCEHYPAPLGRGRRRRPSQRWRRSGEHRGRAGRLPRRRGLRSRPDRRHRRSFRRRGAVPVRLHATSRSTTGRSQHRSSDYLTVRDYIWRWDTDWFWCSGALGVQNPLVRPLLPRRLLRSDVYWKVVGFERRHGWKRALDARRGHASARTGDPGRRGAGRPAGGVPRLLPRRDRHHSGLALPAAPAQPTP